MPGPPIGQQYGCEPMRDDAIAACRAGLIVGAMRTTGAGMSALCKDESGMVSASAGTGCRRGARGEPPIRIGDGRAGRSRRCALPTTAFFEIPIRRPISAVECPSDQSCRNFSILSSVHSNSKFMLRLRVSCYCCFIGTPFRGLPAARRARARKRLAGLCAARLPAGTVVAFANGGVLRDIARWRSD